MRETRVVPLVGVELRDGGESTTTLIRGHAAVFDSPSLDLGGFREIVAPGAFKRTLKAPGNDIRSFLNHDPNYVLGRTGNKTLSVAEDLEGLAFQVQPPATTWAMDLLESMRRGDIADASFAFRTIKDRWETLADNTQLRTLLEVELYELGPVAMGAYPAAESQVRALLEQRMRQLADEDDDSARNTESDPVQADHSLDQVRAYWEIERLSA